MKKTKEEVVISFHADTKQLMQAVDKVEKRINALEKRMKKLGIKASDLRK